MPYLFSISVTLSSLFVVLLLSIKEKKATHYLLAIFFLMASIQVTYLLVFYLGGTVFYIPILSELNTTIPILYAGLIYFYAKAAIQPNFKLSEKAALPLAGFVLYFVTYTYASHMPNIPKMLRTLIHALKPIVNILIIIRFLSFLYKVEQSGYWVTTNKHFRQWLLWLGIGGLIVCSISFTGMMVHHFAPELVEHCGDYYVGSFLSIYFFSLVIVAFRNTQVFQGKWMPRPFNNPAGEATLISEAESLRFQELLTFMDIHKPFLDAQLSLAKLAELQSLPVSKLSRLINQYGNATFFDFVNKYRIAEVKNKIQDSQYHHLSLLGIALDSGFNSKASFNRTFKKMVKMTPSAYRKEILLKNQ